MKCFEEILIQYEPMIWKIIHTLHIYKNQEEFYQTGLIALWEATHGFDETKGSFSSYAYAYIRGRLLSELTKRRKHEDACVSPKDEYWDCIVDESPEIPFEIEGILSYCATLTEQQKKWVLYTALADMSIKQMAEKESVSMSAVKAWRKGAREKLLKRIGKNQR